MRNLKNMTHSQAQESGWEVIKPLDCEVVGKAVFKRKTEAIMKSTKRFPVFSQKLSPDGEQNEIIGWIYNTSTEYHKGKGVSIAEALVFVPLK